MEPIKRLCHERRPTACDNPNTAMMKIAALHTMAASPGWIRFHR
ncbi:MAG TPA: hypothetical protein VD978_09985 [Azospirillum sp.]|nr:hypothetical protein [Azospirillum sp.]